MSASRSFDWSTSAPDIFVVLRNLEPILEACAESFEGVERAEGYYLRTATTHVHDVKDIDATIGRLGEAAKTISLQFETPLQVVLAARGVPALPHRRVELSVRNDASGPSVDLGVTGPDTDETYGFMQRVKNQIDAQVQRQEAAGWTLDPPARQLPPAEPAQSSGQALWATVSSHPFWSALIVALFILGLTIGATQLGWL